MYKKKWILLKNSILLLLSLFLVGCSYKNQFNQDEYLLGGQVFKGNKAVKTEELEPLLPQRPNKKFLGIPGATAALWFYQALDANYDREVPKRKLDSLQKNYEIQLDLYANEPRKLAKIRSKYNKKATKLREYIEGGNWWMQKIGEPPVYFTDKNAQANAAKIKTYLVYQGYRDARVNYTTDTTIGKRIKTTYNIVEGLPYKIQSVDILTHKDAEIDTILKRSFSESFIKKGENYRKTDIENEGNRIEKLLQNNGYFGFNKNYLKPVVNSLGKRYGGFLVDTLSDHSKPDTLAHAVNIRGLQINYPRNQTAHARYHFGSVSFRVENMPGEVQSSERDSAYFKGLSYYFTPKHYYSPKILNDKIAIRPNQLFKISDWRETERQLSLLDQFRIINIEADTVDGQIKTLIRVIPQDKYQITGEGGVNVVQNLPGPFVNSTFRIRNIFGTLENFEFSLRGAYDAQVGFGNSQSLVRSLELGANTALIFPRILFPGKIANSFNRSTPRTIVSLGYNFTNRDFGGIDPDFVRSGFQTSLRYTWKRSENEFLSFTAADLSILKSKQSASFESYLNDLYRQNGNPLKFSFQSAVISSMSFSYIFNNNRIGENKSGHYLRLFLETGGTSLNLLRQQRKAFNEFQLFKFVKTNVEFRRYRPIGPKSNLVYRANAGIIFNYNNERVAPYEKSFTGGGSNSVRAWLPRRLGLGSAYPNVDSTTGSPIFRRGQATLLTPGITSYGPYEYRSEQLGDVLMEANLELRGHLLRFIGDINYAVFLDVGNVWRLRLEKGATNVNQNTINGVFDLNRFYKEFAVGTGAGIRFDISYFVFRFDVGFKVYDPSRRFEIKDSFGQTTVIDERFLLPHLSFRRKSESPNLPVLNIGVGYPF